VRRSLLALLLVPTLLAGSARAGMYFPPAPDTHPVWSPDSTAIVYYKAGEGLRVVSPDGSGNRLLSGIPQSPYFAFSPTWHWLAIPVYQGTPNAFHLDLMRPDGSERRTLATDARPVDPAFSPDGTRVAYAAADGLRVVGIDGGASTRISSEDAVHFAWSPDGIRVAYDTLRSPHVAVAQADGSAVVQGASAASGPAWSPSGQLAFFRMENGRPYLVVDTRRYAIRRWSSARPIWNDDGTAIFYAGGDWLYRIDLATQETARMQHAGLDLARSPDGRFVYAAGGDCADRIGLYVDGARITSDCHVYGTPGPDRIVANGPLYLRVEGLGGDDVLVGNGAAYVGVALDGGAGNDVLRGSWWRDVLDGGPGNDVIRGGPSGDRITGGPGRDRLYGQGGRDTIYARDGERDVVDCGTTIDGSPEHDVASVDKVDVVRNCELVKR
jgi:Tol biopolymer transport system component